MADRHALVTSQDWVRGVGSITGRASICFQHLDIAKGLGPSVTIRVPFYRVRRVKKLVREIGPAMIKKEVKALSVAEHFTLWWIKFAEVSNG